jgi:signal transduction histidine kinase
MLWLQVFHNDPTPRQWPLSPAIARALGDALIYGAGQTVLSDSDSARSCPADVRRQLARRVADDPLIALWCSEHAARLSPPRELCTADDVVDWFITHGLDDLRSDPAPLCDQPTLDADSIGEVQRAAELVELAATLAHLSTTLARAHDDRVAAGGSSSRLPAEAAHLARLVVASTWSAKPGGAQIPPHVRPNAQSDSTHLLPVIENAPRTLQSQATSDTTNPQPAARCVEEAQRRLNQYGDSASPEDPAIAAALAHGSEVRERWSATDDHAAGGALLALVARLGRLADLETRFADSLEREKLAALAEFAGGAGHEINNPLAVIAGRAQLLLPGERDPQRRRELAVIGAQAMRIHEMIADLMLFARPPRPNMARCDLGELVEQVLRPIRDETRERDLCLIFNPPESPVVVTADSAQLAVAVGALIRNSLEALVGSGQIEVSIVWSGGSVTDRWAEIVVRDDGPGLTDEVRRHLFDPYFSGRPAGRGLGMGLSKCWRIVTAHGGRIDVESTPGDGATFRVLLPE